MRMKKRLALLLAAVMLVGLLPTAALAGDDGGASSQIVIVLDNITGGYAANAAGGTIEASTTNEAESFKEIDAFVNDLSKSGAVTSDKTSDGDNGRLRYTFDQSIGTIYLKLTPLDGRTAAVNVPGGSPLSAVDGVYTLTPGEYHIEFQNSGSGGGEGGGPELQPQSTTWVLTDGDGTEETLDIGTGEGESYSFCVADDFDLTNITKVTVTRLGDVEYGDNEFASGKWQDNQNRDLFEIRCTDVTPNRMILGVEFHAGDLENEADKEKYPGFYFFGIMLYKASYRGVEIGSEHMPDMYDFTMTRAAALESATERNPAELTTYYGDSTISLTSVDLEHYDITDIRLAPNCGIPAEAVGIEASEAYKNASSGKTPAEDEFLDVNWHITVHSGFYTEIPLAITVTAYEGDVKTTGYVVIRRIGIDIDPGGMAEDGYWIPLQGAAQQGAALKNTDDKDYARAKNLIAAFYYESGSYDLVATITYNDGSTEVKTVSKYGEVPGQHLEDGTTGTLKAGYYLIWSSADDTSGKIPTKVSVIAVNSTGGSGTTFAGATFGSGAGVSADVRFGGNN